MQILGLSDSQPFVRDSRVDLHASGTFLLRLIVALLCFVRTVTFFAYCTGTLTDPIRISMRVHIDISLRMLLL